MNLPNELNSICDLQRFCNCFSFKSSILINIHFNGCRVDPIVTHCLFCLHCTIHTAKLQAYNFFGVLNILFQEMKQRRANEAKNTGPAQSAAEAFGQMSNKKRVFI